MKTRIIRRREVEARSGLGRSSIYALMAEGKFPRPVKLSARAVGWYESDINEWLEHRPLSEGQRHED